MNKFRKYLLIGFTGPILTFLLYIVSENGLKGLSHLAYLTMLICVGIIITLSIALVVQKYLKRTLTIVVVSSIIAEIIFALMAYFSAFTIVGENDRAEYVMWLPIMIMFMIPFSLPTAITVSFSSVKIIEIRKTR
jgi:uncharacterized protein YacL